MGIPTMSACAACLDSERRGGSSRARPETPRTDRQIAIAILAVFADRKCPMRRDGCGIGLVVDEAPGAGRRQIGRTRATETSTEGTRMRHSILRDGLIAGALGATSVAVWFFVVDM